MNRARLLLLPLAAASLLAGVQPAAAGPYVTSRWTKWSGPVEPCLHAARRVLEIRRLQIDRFGPNQVIGEAGGVTVAVRCDAPGYAFVFFAFTDGAPSQVREQLADDVREELRRSLSGGGGGRY
ncbi:MAG: hypothetical protein JWM77_1315 [Rhodospirillales bacterium]|nr:hypothetical protein [Rhodospirillales bacterium]